MLGGDGLVRKRGNVDDFDLEPCAKAGHKVAREPVDVFLRGRCDDDRLCLKEAERIRDRLQRIGVADLAARVVVEPCQVGKHIIDTALRVAAAATVV